MSSETFIITDYCYQHEKPKAFRPLRVLSHFYFSQSHHTAAFSAAAQWVKLLKKFSTEEQGKVPLLRLINEVSI